MAVCGLDSSHQKGGKAPIRLSAADCFAHTLVLCARWICNPKAIWMHAVSVFSLLILILMLGSIARSSLASMIPSISTGG